MRKKITKKVVDGMTPTDRDIFCWDTNLAGFGLRCRPSGQKYYVLKIRLDGKQRWITLGKHGAPWTPESARKEAQRLIGEGAMGRDPAAARDSMKAAPTVAELGERFLSEYVPMHCKASTTYEYRRAINLFINPALGKHKLPKLAREQVSKFHNGLWDKPYQANRALGVLSKMMNMAEVWGLRSDGTNPCRHVKKYKEQKKARYLDGEELERLGRVLREVEEDESVFPPAVAAIRLLIFTGARLSEILELRWENIDLQQRVLNLPDSKTGAKKVYLNDAAIELLEKLPRLEGNPHVITGAKLGAHLINLQKPWRTIREIAGLEDVRIHDLRHSFASMAVSSGMSLPMIGALLGHSQPATTARYAHLADDPLKAAAGSIGDSLAGAMAGK